MGIEVDIIKEALLKSGYNANSSALPVKRLDNAIQDSNYDVIVGALNQNSKLFYSTSYLELKFYATAKTRKEIQITNIQDLKNLSIGAWPYAWKFFGNDFQKLFAPDKEGKFPGQYSELLNNDIQNRMFWMNRFDISIINKVTFNYYRKILAKDYLTNDEVTFYDILPNDIKFSVAFKDEKIRDDFEHGLEELKRNKRFRRIFESYTK